MPDGLTHFVGAYAIGKPARLGAFLSLFLFGSLLPDILARGGRLITVFLPRPDFAELYAIALHVPLSGVCVTICLSQFFARMYRFRAWLFMFLGCCSHYLLDFLQCTIEGRGCRVLAVGSYYWLYPFSTTDIQCGIFWSEQAYYLLFVFVIIVALQHLFSYTSRQVDS